MRCDSAFVDRPNTPFILTAGTVQWMVHRQRPWYMKHFGHPQYDKHKPVLTDSIREQAQPIVDALNTGQISIAEAEKQLDKIWI